MLDAIRDMESDPFVGDVKPIKETKGLFRRRIGDYRISFTVNFEKDEVVILRGGQREKFYEGT